MKNILTWVLPFVLLSIACKNAPTVKTITPTTEDTSPTTEEKVAVKPVDKAIVIDPILTPDTYEKMAEASGDLDKDDLDEKVIVYNTPRTTDMGTEREIHIYKLENNKWRLWHKSVGAVLPSEHGGMMGDPFQEVTIERGCLVFNHFGGSRSKWAYVHRFRYQNNNWELIGATVDYGAPCESWENFDFNLSTGNVVFKKETESCEDEGEVRTTKETKEFVLKKEALSKMDGFYPGDNEVAIPNSKKTFYY